MTSGVRLVRLSRCSRDGAPPEGKSSGSSIGGNLSTPTPHALDAEKNAGAVRSVMKITIKYMHMSACIAGYAFAHAPLYMNLI